jgi:hypothetical protein
LIDQCDDVGFLFFKKLVRESFGFIKGTNDISSVDSFLDVGNERSTTVGFKTLDLTGGVHVKADEFVVDKTADYGDHEIDWSCDTDQD